MGKQPKTFIWKLEVPGGISMLVISQTWMPQNMIIKGQNKYFKRK